MQLFIDGTPAEPLQGESLMAILKRTGLDSGTLSTRPIAARLGGGIFSLNYVPCRAGEERLRRAVRLAHGQVELLRITSEAGRNVYERSLLFLFLLAVRRRLPGVRVHVQYALGQGIYCTLDRDAALTEADVAMLKEECAAIVRENLTFSRERMDIDDAIEFFSAEGQTDKTELLEWRNFTYFDVYRAGGMTDYFYGEMVPSTGYLTVSDLCLTDDGGILVMMPDAAAPDTAAKPQPMPRLSAIYRESNEWNHLMHCGNVAELNRKVLSRDIRQLVRINEALHEKRYAQIADQIVSRGARAVLIAGPSSSGKTTSANRLCTQLSVHGKQPVLMSLDDYYIDRDKILPNENGEIDLEHIDTIDTAFFREVLSALLRGEEVQPPRFDFTTGRRVMDQPAVRADGDTIFVIEGLHGLNPVLLPDSVDRSLIFRLYVSALTTLNLDDHNRISTSSIRLLRRMVRDFETRGTDVESTIAMWPSVRRGEERWIFPFQEQADAIFNTSLVYEPLVLKRHIFMLLQTVRPDSPCYDKAKDIIKFLNYFLEADIEDEIPPPSIRREFIGGNSFYR